MANIITFESTDNNIFEYLLEEGIDVPCFRHWERLRFTMSIVGIVPHVNVFDDNSKDNLGWDIDVANRTYSRCKNGKWSKPMSVDGFGFEELHIDFGIAE